ncbi:MAG: DUF454 family protein [Intestinibacter sp.]
MIKKIGLIALGTLSLIVGIIGIFLPILPTTPLLLLTSYCYIKSSERLSKKFMNKKYTINMLETSTNKVE